RFPRRRFSCPSSRDSTSRRLVARRCPSRHRGRSVFWRRLCAALASIYHLQWESQMDRPAHAGLRHLALHARDLDAMKRFYIDVLGFTVEWEPDPDNIYLSSGIDNLALHRAKGNVATDGALDHLGVIV